jgi:hypothetical protein
MDFWPNPLDACMRKTYNKRPSGSGTRPAAAALAAARSGREGYPRFNLSVLVGDSEVITVTRNVAGLLSVVALVAAAGCGGGSDSPEAQGAPTAEATTTPAAMQTTGEVPEPAAAEKRAPATLSTAELLSPTEPDARPAVRDTSKIARSSDLNAQAANPARPGPSTLKLEPERLELGTVSTNKNATGTVRLVKLPQGQAAAAG